MIDLQVSRKMTSVYCVLELAAVAKVGRLKVGLMHLKSIEAPLKINIRV